MTVLVTCPDNRHAERLWITSVVLGEFLGLDHEVRFDDRAEVRISAEDKALRMPDVFFSGADGHWLAPASLPAEPLQQWAVGENLPRARLARPCVPVLYGAPGFALHGTTAILHADIFGCAFFMLSRYEEAASPERDRHGRFPAAASLACREGFLARPLVDEYVEILWAAMLRLWPRLQRRQRQPAIRVTCDVDQPYHASISSVGRLLRRTVAEAVRKGRVADALRPVRNYIAALRGDLRHDPYYYTVDWMMDVNEKAGNAVAFYFIPETTGAMDGCYSLGEPAVRDMMRRIAGRGHEIGIHPGYHSYQSRDILQSGKMRLQRAMGMERIRQEVMGGRQHFLRWSTHTPAAWDAAGLEYDSTLGYADHAGFRCGTCHEYPMFDLHQRRALRVRQRPLVCMECSVTSYMGLGWTESALARMKEFKELAFRFDGVFTLLWHNSSFEDGAAKEMYCSIIGP